MSEISHLKSDSMNLHAESLTPPVVNLTPGDTYNTRTRSWQGIPGIERSGEGRLYATWYSGGETEGVDNYVLLVHSDDDGLTWSEPILVIDPPGNVRAYDPVLWIDPQGRLWLFWAQSYGWWNGRGGVWFVRCDEPDSSDSVWTDPQRIADGVMMNKPLVTSQGNWLFPTAVWATVAPSYKAEVKVSASVLPELIKKALSGVVVSQDRGETFSWMSGADVPFRAFDEHMLVEKKDHSLWMLVRTQYGIGQSHSTDQGKTWSLGTAASIAGPNSRFHIRRLPSGRLLLINHVGFTGRSHLTASLSEDDGITWTAHLLLDERPEVSYPDATVSEDGRIWIIYDRERYKAREILMACVTEEDILSGNLCSANSFFKRIVNNLPIHSS